MIRSASFTSASQPPSKQPFSFGSSSTQPAASTGGGLSWGVNNTTNNQSSTTPAQASTSNNTFSFASTPATSNPQQQNTQQPSTSTGTGFSFGQPQASSSGTNNNAGSSSLFGAKPSPFSFGGASTQQQQQQPQQQTNAFGSSTTTGGGGTGLFGGGSSLFGGAKPAGTTSTLGFGQSLQSQQQQQQQQQQTQQQQQQQQQGGSAILNHPYYQKERFNDLSDEARNLVEEMDKMISSQVALRDELTPQLIPSTSSTSNLAPLGQSISQLYTTLQSASTSLASLTSSLESSLGNVKRMQGSVESDRGDLAILWEIGNNFREGRGTGDAKREWLRDYFSKAAQDFQSRIIRYRGSMDQISRHLHSLTSRDTHSPTSISSALHHQHSTFMNLANQVAQLHSEVEVLKKDYREWYSQRFRSVRDPFEGMGEMGGVVGEM